MRGRFLWAALLAGSALTAASAQASILNVGAFQTYTTIAAAAAAAVNGDTLLIDAGTYGCAAFSQNDLTVEAVTAGTVTVTGATCANKGLFVTSGDNIVIEGIKFMNATSTSNNGAGIRAEGGGRLTVRNSEFLTNQMGILTNNTGTMAVVVEDSLFDGNGTTVPGPSVGHGLYVGENAYLLAANNIFTNNGVGHHIKSRADLTILIGNTITDGPPVGSSALIELPEAGDAFIRYNIMTKGPETQNGTGGILFAADGIVNPTTNVVVCDNQFTNSKSSGTSTYFMYEINALPGDVVEGGNTLTANPGAVILSNGTVDSVGACSYDDTAWESYRVGGTMDYDALFDATPTPAPAAAGLLGLGLLSMVRRRKAR